MAQMTGRSSTELEVDESKCREATLNLAPGIDALVLTNPSATEVDGDAMAAWLEALPGIRAISDLTIAPSSRLRDLSVLRGLPSLVNLQVNGSHIQSLDGLQWFRDGRYLALDTGANRRRSIAALAETSVQKVALQYGNSGDFAALAKNRGIGHLVLGGSPQPPFENWRNLPVSVLSLSNGTFKEIADSSLLPDLKQLVLTSCRKLEVFAGNNSGVTWLVIQGCNRLNVSTVSSFVAVEYLAIVGSGKALPLSALGQLSRLKTLSLVNCKVDVELMDLSRQMPLLETLELAGLKDVDARRLSEANAKVAISTGASRYQAGVRAD